MPRILALRRLKLENFEFQASLGYNSETLSQTMKTKQNKLGVVVHA
jgi:hypothetical protein